MNINDLETTPPTIDPTPRLYPRGIRRRQVEAGEKPTFELRGSHLLAAAISACFLAGLVILFYSFTGSKPVQQAQPTDVPLSRVFSAPPTALPVTPRSTEAPTPVQPTPAPVLAAPVEPPVGQGLTLAEPEQAPVVDQYLENVAAQAPHSPRGDGQAGQSGGDWVAVPTITSEQAEIIGAQAPHTVR